MSSDNTPFNLHTKLNNRTWNETSVRETERKMLFLSKHNKSYLLDSFILLVGINSRLNGDWFVLFLDLFKRTFSDTFSIINLVWLTMIWLCYLLLTCNLLFNKKYRHLTEIKKSLQISSAVSGYYRHPHSELLQEDPDTSARLWLGAPRFTKWYCSSRMK